MDNTSLNGEEKIIKVRVVSPSEELAKKHPILFCFLIGGGLIGVGILLSFFIIGIPLIVVGLIFVLIGFLGIVGRLFGWSLGKLPIKISSQKPKGSDNHS